MAETQDTQEAQFDDSPTGWAKRWEFEIEASRKVFKKWQEQAEKIVKRFLDQRDGTLSSQTRWNFFTSNVQTQRALLYGKTPQTSVERRFSDFEDDIARVAAEMLERLLNTDIERDGDTFSSAMENSLLDRLLAGLAVARVRLESEFETTEGKPAIVRNGVEAAPAVPPVEQPKPGSMDVCVDYINWNDVLWNAEARTWHEVRWLAFRNQMSREALLKRFGEKIGKQVPLNSKRSKYANGDVSKSDPWSRADVWEIWNKDTKEVFWWVEGFGLVLDRKDDPLELENFWPCARPMFANITTSALLPRPDFTLYEDLYNEIDLVSSRITAMMPAIKVAGLYDKTTPAVGNLLKAGVENKLVPAENWAAFAEKGGLTGALAMLPIEPTTAAVAQLEQYRDNLIQALFQLTGMSDIMRGQQDGNGTPGEAQVKARFASVRMQAMQDEFARFCSDTQRLKAEIISKHFDVQTILQRSNAAYTVDVQQQEQQLQAAQLIKDKFACYRVQVKPEAVSMTDFAALRAERTDFLATLSAFMTAAPGLLQIAPGSLPYMLKLLQFTAAGMKGASQAEAILDQAINAAEQQQAQQAASPQMQQPDPKVQAQQQKAQLDMAKQQQKTQGDLLRIQAETQANAQQQEDQAKWNIYEQVQKERIKQGGGGVGMPIAPAMPGGAL